MTLPITVKPVVTKQLLGSPIPASGYRPVVYYESVTKTKQPAPYDKVAYYDRERTVGGGSSSSSTDLWYYNVMDLSDDSSIAALAQNRALMKLRSNAFDSADLGVSLIEARDSLNMIAKRAGQLYQFTKAVKRFDFLNAATILGLHGYPKGVKKNAKNAASNWLEYWLGWAPLVGDIGNAVSVLQSPYKTLSVKSSSSASRTYRTSTKSGSLPGAVTYGSEVFTWNVRCNLAMDFSVTNPNLHLANQLGFVNPYSIAWELVPLSFVVDWFVNVGDFLGQWTAFAGLTSVNQRTTYLHKQKKRLSYMNDVPVFEWVYPPGQPAYSRLKERAHVSRNGSAERFHVQRFNSVSTTIKLGFNPPDGLSPTRGATAISLLLGAMPR